MTDRSDPTIRFAVGTPDGPQSIIWRLWVHGSDVYLMPRLARHWKVSLHQSGKCHWGFETEAHLLAAADSAVATLAQGRYLDMWDMPEPFAPGWTRAFTVIVPMSELSTPRTRRKNAGVHWAQPVRPDGAVNFAVLFGPPSVEVDDVPTVRGQPTIPMFGATLADCMASVWLICYSEVLPPAAAQLLSQTRASQDAEDRRARAETMPDPTSFAYGTVEDDGGRFYLEVRSPQG